MKDRTIATIAIAMLVYTLVLAFCTSIELVDNGMRMIPQCHEDVALVGIGDFEDGLWTEYECGPAVDDFMP